MCASASTTENQNSKIEEVDSELLATSLVYENELGDLITEDLTNRKTLVVFWADY